jgi:hypothetical protein
VKDSEQAKLVSAPDTIGFDPGRHHRAKIGDDRMAVTAGFYQTIKRRIAGVTGDSRISARMLLSYQQNDLQ